MFISTLSCYSNLDLISAIKRSINLQYEAITIVRDRLLIAQSSDAQPSDAQSSDAQPSDAQPSDSDAQPAPCQPLRPSPRLREPFPRLRSPDSVRAPRPSAIRRNARFRPRCPVRCPRQPRQRFTSAEPSSARRRARQLKKKFLKKNPAMSVFVVFGCRCCVATIYCDGHYFYWTGKVWYLEPSAGTSDHERAQIERRPPPACRQSYRGGYFLGVHADFISFPFIPNAPWTAHQS